MAAPDIVSARFKKLNVVFLSLDEVYCAEVTIEYNVNAEASTASFLWEIPSLKIVVLADILESAPIKRTFA